MIFSAYQKHLYVCYVCAELILYIYREISIKVAFGFIIVCVNILILEYCRSFCIFHC
jgi:hypothetical protein